MERMVFAMALVGATIVLVPGEQNVPHHSYDWTGARISTGSEAHLAASSEGTLQLNPGSQQPVLAPITLGDTGNAPVTETPENRYSATMHDLAAHMLNISPKAQEEVVWLVKALADETGAPRVSPNGADLTDHLYVLAQSIGQLSEHDRRIVVDLAASLAGN